MPRKTQTIMHRLVSLALSFALALFYLAPLPAAEIEYFPSLEAARKPAEAAPDAADQPASPRPAVLVFSAEWCGWCHKLEGETLASPEVAAIADRFVWVKIDLDREEALAARYRVRGVPHLAVLDGEDRLVASRSGFLSPAACVAFLNSSLTASPVEGGSPAVELAKTPPDDPAEFRAWVRQVVEQLARPETAARKEYRAALAARSREAAPQLVEMLGDARLAVRAAAYQSLQATANARLPFQPFAAPEDTIAAREAWQAWATTAAEQKAAPAEAPTPKADP